MAKVIDWLLCRVLGQTRFVCGGCRRLMGIERLPHARIYKGKNFGTR